MTTNDFDLKAASAQLDEALATLRGVSLEDAVEQLAGLAVATVAVFSTLDPESPEYKGAAGLLSLADNTVQTGAAAILVASKGL